MVKDVINLDVISHFSFAEHSFKPEQMTDQVILDLILFFKRHSYPNTDLVTLLQTPNKTLYDLYSFVCSFLDSVQEVSEDAIFLDDLNFLLTFHDLPIPADIYDNFLKHLEIWKKD